MARPTKQGIDYFPIDVDFDDKVEMYLLEKEAVGLASLITIWQLIYKNEGYYVTNGNDLLLMVKKRISSDINTIKECINVCLDRGVFDKYLYGKYQILTSRGIQKRYFDASTKKKEVKYNPKFMLIDVSNYENLIKVGINEIDSRGNATKEEEKEEVKVEVEVNGDNAETLFNSWNNFADEHNLAQIKSLTDERLMHIKKRLVEKTFNFEEVLKKAGESDFLKGANKTNWKITFDWVIESKNNYIKILEGKYTNSVKGEQVKTWIDHLGRKIETIPGDEYNVLVDGIKKHFHK